MQSMSSKTLIPFSITKWINRYGLIATVIIILPISMFLWQLIRVHTVSPYNYLPLPLLILDPSSTQSTYNINLPINNPLSIDEQIQQCLSFQPSTINVTNKSSIVICPQTPNNNWNINWNYLLSELNYQNITEKHYSNISNSIEWNNPQYKGFCRPLLYPHIAITRNLCNLNDLSYEF